MLASWYRDAGVKIDDHPDPEDLANLAMQLLGCQIRVINPRYLEQCKFSVSFRILPLSKRGARRTVLVYLGAIADTSAPSLASPTTPTTPTTPTRHLSSLESPPGHGEWIFTSFYLHSIQTLFRAHASERPDPESRATLNRSNRPRGLRRDAVRPGADV